ncbi:hypothetical protein [Shewanella atlantica]|uniref:hypothetical protein n=1 Tax=Shewanella atlantica TaxID=271099 RepID=UPI003736E912
MSRYSGVGQAIILSGLLSLFSLNLQASDRFNWSSNVWVQPSWSSSWGHYYPGYDSGWRWGVGISTGSPYWNNHGIFWNNSWNSSWNRPYWNNHYRPYWRNSWNYPYRYERREYKRPEPKVIAPPQRVTTDVQYASGLKSLPANARVIQRDGRTIYEWQGIEYQFDWSSQSYRELK